MLSYISPGPDWLIITKNIIREKNGVYTALGVQSGLFIHMLIGAMGASVVLNSSPLAFEILQLSGACYLIWLGFQSLKDIKIIMPT